MVNGHVISVDEAKRMTRWQALKALQVFGDREDQHMANLMLEGPAISEEEAKELQGKTMTLKPLAKAVLSALAALEGRW